MPNEYEFMKSAKEKQMPDEEYNALREQYDKKLEEAGDRVKRTLVAFLIVLAISFVALHVFTLLNSEADSGYGVGNYTFLAVQFFMAVFFYGLKAEEDKRNQYETDRRILLDYIKRKITAFKIRLGLVIGIGSVFVVLNIICWWFAFQFGAMESRTGYALSELLSGII